MRIVFVGQLWYGSTALQRMTALQDLGHDVTSVDITLPNKRKHWTHQLPTRILARLGYPLDSAGANRRILQLVEPNTVDLLWIDKGLSITPSTLKIVKARNSGCRLLFYSPDDMMLSGNQSRFYLASLPLYNLHVTTKSYNVAELKAMGARDVFFVPKSYDPHTHRPVLLTVEERARLQTNVGFVGGIERHRYEMMKALAEAGVQVMVRGPGWEPYTDQHPNLLIKPGWVCGDKYAKTICATKINLCFLRKVARDLQTARSIEIPACGAFMLAERTDEHLALFREGREAEFFGDQQELEDKVRFYLVHDDKRERIAATGRKRCVESGYSNHDRLQMILTYLQDKVR